MLTWDWNHLNPAASKDFQWVYGTTPMSDLSVIYQSWVIYFVAIVAIRWYMAERTRIDRSHKAMIFYNGSMILCSTYVWYTASISFWLTIRHNQDNGYFTYCQAAEYTAYKDYGGRMFYSMYICYLLRYYVYLDTIILALRKKSIPFLHWYQHMFVILMIWSWLQDQSIFGSLAVAIISFVQVFRYCYYFCHCANIQTTRIKNTAFVFEVIQFIAGITLTVYQMSICPQSNCILLSASINVTMVYIIVKYYGSNEKAVATTREHYKRRQKELLELPAI